MVVLQKKVSYMRWSFFGNVLSQRLQYTFSKCIITIQDVLKKGNYHEMGQKLKYMTSINLVALSKKFTFVRWRLFGAFSQNTLQYLQYLHRTVCPKNGQCHEMGLKLKYMISIIIADIPKNVFLYGVEAFVSLLS